MFTIYAINDDDLVYGWYSVFLQEHGVY